MKISIPAVALAAAIVTTSSNLLGVASGEDNVPAVDDDDDEIPWDDDAAEMDADMDDDMWMPVNNTGHGNMTRNECLLKGDTCHYAFDGICDAGDSCPEGSDCWDCIDDPCTDYNYDCGACTQNGCYWCPGDASCFSEWIDVEVLQKLGKFANCKSQALTTCPALGENEFSDPLYDSMQWAYDMINVAPVWKMGLTGAGVHVRVNDDGVDAQHAEFINKFDMENSCEINQPSIDSETGKLGDHGTACASLLLAEGDNDVCAVGIAPGATVSACVLAGDEADPDDEGNRLSHKLEVVDISSNSWGPIPCEEKDQRGRRLRILQENCPFNTTNANNPCDACAGGIDQTDQDCYWAVVDYCANYEQDPMGCANYLDWFVSCDYAPLPSDAGNAITRGILEGRGGLGVIYTWAAGNDYTWGADTNGDGYANSRYTIAVAAVGKDALHASYSTPGAVNLVAAPGGDDENFSNNIVALPGTGTGCHDITVGTSFACPTVSGVIALMLEATPTLGWRDVQGILALTAKMTDARDESWVVNGAGLPHSNKYGFGIVNAFAAVNMSKTWVNWGPEKQIMKESGVINLAIENDAETLVSNTLMVSGMEGFVAESVSVFLDLDHKNRGDLLIVLTSPSGTKSILHPSKRPEASQLAVSWKLTTVKNFFEDPNGNWTLSLADENQGKATAGDCFDIDTIFNCDFYGNASYGYCEDGAPANETMAVELAEEFDEDNNNITILEACCGCGGGVIATDVETLISWKMIIYGHEESSDDIVEAVAKRGGRN